MDSQGQFGAQHLHSKPNSQFIVLGFWMALAQPDPCHALARGPRRADRPGDFDGRHAPPPLELTGFCLTTGVAGDHDTILPPP